MVYQFFNLFVYILLNTSFSTTATIYHTIGISFGRPLYTLGGGTEVGEGFVLGSGIVAYTLRKLKLNY